MSQHKIAIIGPRDEVLGFQALGMEPIAHDTPEGVVEKILALKKEEMNGKKKYAVLFILEFLIVDISNEDYKKISADVLPAVIAIPGHNGPSGAGEKKIRRIVEKAIGSDIFGS